MTKPTNPTGLVAQAIQRKLALLNIFPHSVQPSTATSCVDVVTIDAQPSVQQAVEEAAAPHRRGRFLIGADAYDESNRRDDVPQVDHVIIQHSLSPELTRQLNAFVESTHPEVNNAALTDVDHRQALIKGRVPGFWNAQTGKNEPPRCCVCQKPVEDLDRAWSNKRAAHTLYRHTQCGDFYPPDLN